MAAADRAFHEAVPEICEQRARLATFLKEMYEKESPSRVARACEEVFVDGILDFFREIPIENLGDERYFYEERAERERELQDLAVQIIAHAGDLNSRMLRSSGNWALIYRDPWNESDAYSYSFEPDKMHLRQLEDVYVARENPTSYLGPLQEGERDRKVQLALTPGLWNFTEWVISGPHETVPHIRPEVSTYGQLMEAHKKILEQNAIMEGRNRPRGRGRR